MVALMPIDHVGRPVAVAAQDATSIVATGAAVFTAEEQLALTTSVETSLAERNTPGAMVGIWYLGRGNWAYATGIQDLVTAKPVTPNSHAWIASITKTFTATVIRRYPASFFPGSRSSTATATTSCSARSSRSSPDEPLMWRSRSA